MGKRELVLIAVFVVLGIVVYQLTAPPPPPGSEGVSLSGIFRNMKRGVQGARESATADSQQTAAVDAAVRELRVNISRSSDVTVTGEDRDRHRGRDARHGARVRSGGGQGRRERDHAEDRAGRRRARGEPWTRTAARNLPQNSGISQMVDRAQGAQAPGPADRAAHRAAGGPAARGRRDHGVARRDARSTGFAGRVVLTHSGGALEIDDVALAQAQRAKQPRHREAGDGPDDGRRDRRRPDDQRDRRAARDRGAQHRAQDRRHERSQAAAARATAPAAKLRIDGPAHGGPARRPQHRDRRVAGRRRRR